MWCVSGTYWPHGQHDRKLTEHHLAAGCEPIRTIGDFQLPGCTCCTRCTRCAGFLTALKHSSRTIAYHSIYYTTSNLCNVSLIFKHCGQTFSESMLRCFKVFLASPQGDLCGHEKYLKTTIFGLVGQCQGTKLGSVRKRYAKAIYKTKQLWYRRSNGWSMKPMWNRWSFSVCNKSSELELEPPPPPYFANWRIWGPDYTMIIVNANAGFQRMSREHLGILGGKETFISISIYFWLKVATHSTLPLCSSTFRVQFFKQLVPAAIRLVPNKFFSWVCLRHCPRSPHSIFHRCDQDRHCSTVAVLADLAKFWMRMDPGLSEVGIKESYSLPGTSSRRTCFSCTRSSSLAP